MTETPVDSTATYAENLERTSFTITRTDGITLHGETVELAGGAWEYWTQFVGPTSSHVSATTHITAADAAAKVTAWKAEAGVSAR